jgi:CubicO group peptidase (beta-lactamase class C family)
MSITTVRISLRAKAGVLAIVLTALNGQAGEQETGPKVRITTVPAVVYTSTQGVYLDASGKAPTAYAAPQNLTWMFHLVFESTDRQTLRIEEVEATFSGSGTRLWRQSYSRAYLERMEWVAGAYSLTTKYFLDHVMFGREEKATPDLAPGAAISWVRAAFAQPWFARADRVDLRFTFGTETGAKHTLTHTVPLVSRTQEVRLRMPFTGTWLVVKGSDLAPITHRWTGLNGLTTYGWDFMKLGEDGALYKGTGRAPTDRYSYGADVLAPAEGRVVHVRNDIDDYGGNPPRDVLEKDGDVFSGNLVVLDHGNREFTLTCHLQKGSVLVKVGYHVRAGQPLGKIGELGILHLNVMDGGEWLKANGLPALVSDFERVLPVGDPQPIALGNPVTGWMVRPLDSRATTSPLGANANYAPSPGEAWETRRPEQLGMDPVALDRAIAYARSRQTQGSRDLHEVMSARVAPEGHGGIIGPMKPRGEFSGLVLRNGYIVSEFGDTSRVDMTFSATKSFLALAAGLAVDSGLIESVDDPVGRYVKDGSFEGPRNSKVTWKHLMHQTSEWEGALWGKPYTVEQPAGHVLQEPGTVWVHNDVRVNLLSRSLLQVWRRPLPAVLKERVMDPIGASPTWEWHGYHNSHVSIDGRSIASVSGGGHWGGGLFISARDLARVGLLMLRRGAWGGRRIVSSKWVEEVTTPCPVEPTYGYLWWLNTGGKLWPSAPHRSFAMRGFGSNVVWVDPDHDLVLVLRWFEWEQLDGILKRLLRAVNTSS